MSILDKPETMKILALSILFVLSVGTSYALPNNYTKTKADSVLICRSNTAYAYHLYECRGLARCAHKIIKVTLEQAKKMGYKPCKICYR